MLEAVTLYCGNQTMIQLNGFTGPELIKLTTMSRTVELHAAANHRQLQGQQAVFFLGPPL
jgi:hypothetical protein